MFAQFQNGYGTITNKKNKKKQFLVIFIGWFLGHFGIDDTVAELREIQFLNILQLYITAFARATLDQYFKICIYNDWSTVKSALPQIAFVLCKILFLFELFTIHCKVF